MAKGICTEISVVRILVEHRHDGPRITFIDFGFSRKFSRRIESEDEMAALKKMIGFRSLKRRRSYSLGLGG